MDIAFVIVGAIFLGLSKAIDSFNIADSGNFNASESSAKITVLIYGALSFTVGILLLIFGIVPAFVH